MLLVAAVFTAFSYPILTASEFQEEGLASVSLSITSVSRLKGKLVPVKRIMRVIKFASVRRTAVLHLTRT
jgi:hypothetical protein